MSAETRPNGTATAAPVQPSPELVNGLLKWPEQLRLNLARLLFDSVKEGFTSLEEAEQRDKDLIHSRIEQLVSGKVELLDPEEMFAAIRQAVAEVRRP